MNSKKIKDWFIIAIIALVLLTILYLNAIESKIIRIFPYLTLLGYLVVLFTMKEKRRRKHFLLFSCVIFIETLLLWLMAKAFPFSLLSGIIPVIVLFISIWYFSFLYMKHKLKREILKYIEKNKIALYKIKIINYSLIDVLNNNRIIKRGIWITSHNQKIHFTIDDQLNICAYNILNENVER